MPFYDYYCHDCHQPLTVYYKSYAAYDAAEHRCPECDSVELTRLISQIAIAKSGDARLDAIADKAISAGADENDPKTISRFMRDISREAGRGDSDGFEA